MLWEFSGTPSGTTLEGMGKKDLSWAYEPVDLQPHLYPKSKLLLVSFIGTSKALFGKINKGSILTFSPRKLIVKPTC